MNLSQLRMGARQAKNAPLISTYPHPRCTNPQKRSLNLLYTSLFWRIKYTMVPYTVEQILNRKTRFYFMNSEHKDWGPSESRKLHWTDISCRWRPDNIYEKYMRYLAPWQKYMTYHKCMISILCVAILYGNRLDLDLKILNCLLTPQTKKYWALKSPHVESL